MCIYVCTLIAHKLLYKNGRKNDDRLFYSAWTLKTPFIIFKWRSGYMRACTLWTHKTVLYVSSCSKIIYIMYIYIYNTVFMLCLHAISETRVHRMWLVVNHQIYWYNIILFYCANTNIIDYNTIYIYNIHVYILWLLSRLHVYLYIRLHRLTGLYLIWYRKLIYISKNSYYINLNIYWRKMGRNNQKYNYIE